MKDVTLDIRTIFRVLFEKWIWILVVTLASLVLTFSITKFLVTPKYTSTTDLYVLNKDLLGNQETSQQGSASYYSYKLQLVKSYIKMLSFDDTKLLVLEALKNNNEDVTMTQLNDAVTITSDGETDFVTITALTTDPELSKKICDAYAEIAPERIKSLMTDGSVLTQNAAKIAASPSSPNVVRNTALGGLIGLVVICGIIILISVLDNTVKDGQAAAQHLNVQLLGEIPDILETFKGSYNYKSSYSTYAYKEGKD